MFAEPWELTNNPSVQINVHHVDLRILPSKHKDDKTTHVFADIKRSKANLFDELKTSQKKFQ